jgi:hypothetical protein
VVKHAQQHVRLAGAHYEAVHKARMEEVRNLQLKPALSPREELAAASEAKQHTLEPVRRRQFGEWSAARSACLASTSRVL